MKKIYNKLVRDKIPEIIKTDGFVPTCRKLSQKEFKLEVLKKVLEEAREMYNAKDSQKELVKECADLEEVLFAVMNAYKISRSELNKIRNKRKKDRGGFTKKIFLEKMTKKA